VERPDSRFSPLLTRMNLLSRKFFPRVRVTQSCEASRPIVLIGPPGGAYSPGNEADARPSAVATSSSSWPRERAGTVYPEGVGTGKRLGGSVLSIQATTAECR